MPRPGSLLAIDHGTKRTGFAVADALRASIEPLEVFHGAGDGQGLIDRVVELAGERSMEAIVVGYPYAMDGSEGPRARDVATFCERLGERVPDVEIVRVDERLTTKEAEMRLVEAGHVGQARKARRDSWSAAVLLEGWILAGEPRGD